MGAKILEGLNFPHETEITALTVVPEHTFLGGLSLDMFRGGDKSKAAVRKSEKQKATEYLQGVTLELWRKGLHVDTLVRWGKPSEQITAAAHQLKADLVVAGAKGTGTSPLFPFGNTAQKVMKHAGCSVLIVRGKSADIERVLLATDGSEHAEAAVNLLINLPLSASNSVIPVTALHSHVATYLKMPTLDLETNQDILADLQAAEEKAAQDLLEATKQKLRKRYAEVLPVILRGDPTQEILAAAERFNPDLVVLGAKGLSRMETFMLGSVAQRVTKYAPCSVLIARP